MEISVPFNYIHPGLTIGTGPTLFGVLHLTRQ